MYIFIYNFVVTCLSCKVSFMTEFQRNWKMLRRQFGHVPGNLHTAAVTKSVTCGTQKYSTAVATILLYHIVGETGCGQTIENSRNAGLHGEACSMFKLLPQLFLNLGLSSPPDMQAAGNQRCHIHSQCTSESIHSFFNQEPHEIG